MRTDFRTDTRTRSVEISLAIKHGQGDPSQSKFQASDRHPESPSHRLAATLVARCGLVVPRTVAHRGKVGHSGHEADMSSSYSLLQSRQ